MNIKIDKDDLALWNNLCHQTRCKLCKRKFPDGIVKKLPRDISTPLIQRFTDEYLEHMKSTHGLFPSMIEDIILRKFKTHPH